MQLIVCNLRCSVHAEMEMLSSRRQQKEEGEAMHHEFDVVPELEGYGVHSEAAKKKEGFKFGQIGDLLDPNQDEGSSSVSLLHLLR